MAWMLLAAAPASADYDTFDSETLNSTDASGNELPFAPSSQTVLTTPDLNTATFTVQNGEQTNDGRDMTGCVLGPGSVSWGGRTAWVRFVPKVYGTFVVDAQTLSNDYDVILWMRDGPAAPRGTTPVGDIGVVNRSCIDAIHVGGSEKLQGPSLKIDQSNLGRTFWFQTAGLCASGPPPGPVACPSPNTAPGGLTRIRLTFTPVNGDGDGVSDPLDQCPATPGTQSDGCPPPAPPAPPDADGDGFPDSEDFCFNPGFPGAQAVPPFNGCPAGPTPPPGRVGVLINGGATVTRERLVTLGLVWPPGAQRVEISNQGGGPAQSFALVQQMRWPLEQAFGDVRSRVVRARFIGPGIERDVSDEIDLDETPPRTQAAVQVAAGRSSHLVAIRATDNLSGVASARISDSKGRLLAAPRFCPASGAGCKKSIATTLTVKSKAVPKKLELFDAAGNRTLPTAIAAQAPCAGTPAIVNFKPACLKPGAGCNPSFNSDYQRYPVSARKRFSCSRRTKKLKLG
jgi:hypothetical protein